MSGVCEHVSLVLLQESTTASISSDSHSRGRNDHGRILFIQERLQNRELISYYLLIATMKLRVSCQSESRSSELEYLSFWALQGSFWPNNVHDKGWWA